MARRGRFGRLPTAAPSLTNTLVAIAREMQNTEDQAIMDAWKNGGSYQGKPVTDEMVLAHWNQRLAGVAKDDPLYDVYKNTITQYEYSIAESKQSVLYKQGKISDSQMAAFYINWSKKVPRDSEFWRTLQRDGAQFMRASKATKDAADKQAKEDQYQKDQLATYKGKERVGEYLTGVLGKIAQANALIPGYDLNDFDPSDPAAMNRLLDLINGKKSAIGGTPFTDPTTGDTSVRLYEDPPGSGKFVTSQMVLDKLGKWDPSFTGTVTNAYVTGALREQMQGQTERITRAKKTGHASDANSLQNWQAATSKTATQVKAWPVEESYQAARDQFLETWNDITASPEQKTKAFDTYAGVLNTLAATPGLDMATSKRLIAEATGDGTVDSLAESFTGLSNSDHTTTSGTDVNKGDIAGTWADLTNYRTQVEVVGTQGSGYVWTMGEYKNGVFVPAAGGKEIGAAPASQVVSISRENPVAFSSPQADGSPLTIYTVGVPVMAAMTNEDGVQVQTFASGSASASAEVGTAYDVTIMGQTVRVYGFKASDGSTYYTHDPFWDTKTVKSHDTPSGVVLDLSAYAITQRPQLDANGNQVEVADPSGAKKADGTPKMVKAWDYYNSAGVKLEGAALDTLKSGKAGLGLNSKGDVIVNPTVVTFSTDPSRNAAGIDPNTDSPSPTLSAVMGLPNWKSVLSSAWNDETFRTQVDDDIHERAGYTKDLATGQWVGGDETKLKSLQAGVELVIDPVGLSSPYTPISLDFDKTTTKPTFSGGISASWGVSTYNAPTSTAGYALQPVTSDLPSDQARGTDWHALASVFVPKTSQIETISKDVFPSTSVKAVGVFKLPVMPPIVSTVKPTIPSSSSSTIPSMQSTGSTAPTSTSTVPTMQSLVTTAPASNGSAPYRRSF